MMHVACRRACAFILAVGLLEGIHSCESHVVLIEQGARPRVLRVEDIHVVGANVAVSIMVEQIKAESQLLFVALTHHTRTHCSKIRREIDRYLSSQVQRCNDSISHHSVILL